MKGKKLSITENEKLSYKLSITLSDGFCFLTLVLHHILFSKMMKKDAITENSTEAY